MSEFEGTFQLTDSENVDAFMKAVGSSQEATKLVQPVMTIAKEEEVFTVKREGGDNFSFKLDEQFEMTTNDGRKVLSTMRVTGPNVMMHEMLGTDGGKDSVCYREFTPEKMKVECSAGGVIANYTYKRL